MSYIQQLSAKIVGRLRDLALKTPLKEVPGLKPAYDRVRAATTPSEPVWIDYRGYDLYVDPTDRIGYQLYRGKWEPDVEKTIREHVPAGGTAIDIGGHFGVYTLLLRSEVGPEGTVVTFEPHPDNAAMIRKTIAHNGFENVTLDQRAVGESPGTTELQMVEETSLSSTYEGVDLQGQFEQDVTAVETVALGSYLAERFDRVDFLKMDIQGAEVAAIAGLADYLEHVDSILLEVHDTLSESEVTDIFETLDAHGTLTDIETDDSIERVEALNDALHVLWTNENARGSDGSTNR